ncbi:hypothetical protein [Ruegeria atlantica]|uniref:hypothetical protein n=1 Tax=Ruegeria atlantica TaxID=81569 RepID=UPI002493D49D|nr:hypothetical protein [Ruegeria atlantica]
MTDVDWLSNIHRNASAIYVYRPVGFSDVPRPPRDDAIGVAFRALIEQQEKHLPIDDHALPKQLYAVK